MKVLSVDGLSKLISLMKEDFVESSSLSTVATSGSYNDLSNKPTIPTVDQTYNASSTNAQSGVAIANAKFLQNKSTGTDGIAIGNNISSANGVESVTIGYTSSASGKGSIAIGHFSATAAENAIQLGYGGNTTANTFKVGAYYNNASYNWEMLNIITGKIPDDRLNNPIPSQSGNSGKFLTTNGTTASWATVSAGDSLPDQTGNSGKFLTTNGTTASWGNALQNTATGNNALTILGNNTNYTYALNIGYGSSASSSGATAIGALSTATGGSDTFPMALGYHSSATADGAIQIGVGENSTARTLQVGFYINNSPYNYQWTLLDGATGKIPNDRLNLATTSTAGIVKPDGTTITITNDGIISAASVANALQNTATGSNSLTLLGIGTNSDNSTNIGYSTTITGDYSTAIGFGAAVTGDRIYGVAIGSGASVSNNYAIQIGKGLNTEANSLYIGLSNINNYKLLGSNGKIPDDRLNTTIARTNQLPTIATTSTAGIVKPDGTTIVISNDGTLTANGGGGGTLPTQTGHSGEFLTTDGTIASWTSAPTPSTATTSTLGLVKPDGVSITIDNNGTLTATNGGVYAMVITDYTEEE